MSTALSWSEPGSVSAHDVTAAIVQLTGPVARTTLQKLLYYSQAWSLAFNDRPLFNEHIEAWQLGPVVPVVWRAHESSASVTRWPEGDGARLDPAASAIVTWVVSTYGHLTAGELSELTHLEKPWRTAWGPRPLDARGNTPITCDAMKAYYRRLVRRHNAGAHTLASLRFEGLEVSESAAEAIRAVASGRADVNEVIKDRLAAMRRG